MLLSFGTEFFGRRLFTDHMLRSHGPGMWVSSRKPVQGCAPNSRTAVQEARVLPKRCIVEHLMKAAPDARAGQSHIFRKLLFTSLTVGGCSERDTRPTPPAWWYQEDSQGEDP